MARNFNMVSPAIWRSKRWATTTDDGRLLALYILTNDHQNSAGCYRLLPGYGCADLGGWALDRFQAALAAIETADIVITDSSTSEILIQRWFKHCPPTNSKHYQGTLRIAFMIESDRLRQLTVDSLNAAWDAAQAARAAKNAADVVPISPELRSRVRSTR